MPIFKIKDANGNWIIPEDPTAVKYTQDQMLTDAQKAIARANIGAAAGGAAPIKRYPFDIFYHSTATITPTKVGDNVYQVKYIFTPYASCQSAWWAGHPFDIIVSLPVSATYDAYETFYIRTSSIDIVKKAQTQDNIIFQICPNSNIDYPFSFSFAIDLVVDTNNRIIYTKLGENGLFYNSAII